MKRFLVVIFLPVVIAYAQIDNWINRKLGFGPSSGDRVDSSYTVTCEEQ